MPDYFYMSEIPAPNETGVLSPEESRHLVEVLRGRPGTEIGLIDGEGTRGSGVVSALQGKQKKPEVVVRVHAKDQIAPPKPQIHLVVAPPRAKQMDTVVRQATEVGVRRITPVLTARGVSRPFKANKIRHWQAEAVAAMKQSGNPYLPAIDALMDFADVLSETEKPAFFGDTVFPAGAEHWEPFRAPENVTVWVGPEGGFTAEEREALMNNGVNAVKVGPWTLRVETAVPVLLGALQGAVYQV